MGLDPGLLLRPESLTAFTQPADVVLDALSSNRNGLDSQACHDRLQSFGENSLPLSPGRPFWARLLSQFRNVLIYLLLGSALVSLLLGHLVDSGIILAVVLVNAAVGFIQEGRAESALRSILAMTRSYCLVWRDGILVSLDSVGLVPGDVVQLAAGDRVPADLRLLEVREMSCDESALTGESQTVSKQTQPLSADTILAERTNMAYMGTMVVSGSGTGIVCQTGSRTQLGNINAMVQELRITGTPLQVQMQRFARRLTAMILGLAAAVMVFGVLGRGFAVADMLQAAIGIAVASIPEAMPAIVTVTLAFGVMRMARRKALIRRLPAVEVLGSVNVICVDKTGTLTANLMSVRILETVDSSYRIEGEGYSPVGQARVVGGSRPGPGNDPLLTAAAKIALLCNDANVVPDASGWIMHGDPTEGALLTFALRTGMDASDCRRHFPRKDVLPFSSEKRFMVTRHKLDETTDWVALKGAPDRLLELCSLQLGSAGPEPLDQAFWQQSLKSMAGSGMRVIALAQKNIAAAEPLTWDLASQGLVLVALAGISDPPRPEAITAVGRCHAAGIRVKMITGDNPLTAVAIGRELGLNSDAVLTGRELDELGPAQLIEAAQRVDIFARTSAANKLQLVEALKSNGNVVAMTGDGVNDAPALRRADIGVAMGKRGTDAAREASDLVLTDDNFVSIADAVVEGRTVYDNIVKSIVFILPTSIAEAAVIAIAILLGYQLPITAAQVLWINMATTLTLDLALMFEPPEPDNMLRAPRGRTQPLLGAQLLAKMMIAAAAGAVLAFALFNHYLAQGAAIEYARTVAVTSLVAFECVFLLACRSLHQTIFSRHFLTGISLPLAAIATALLLQWGFIYLQFMQDFFDVEPLLPRDWTIIAGTALLVLPLVELEKQFGRWRNRHTGLDMVPVS